MPGHAATGTSPGQPGAGHRRGPRPPVHQAPRRTPAGRARTSGTTSTTNVRGNAHVLLTMDETTYDPGGNAHGLRPPDLLVQALRRRPRLGHRAGPLRRPLRRARAPRSTSSAASSTRPASSPATAAAPIDANFEKVTLDDNTSAPIALDVAPDGRVFFTELVRGQIRVYDPADGRRQDRAHARRLLRRRGRPARHRRSTPTSRPTAGSTSTTRPTGRTTPTRRTASTGSPASRSTATRIDPASEQLIIEVPAEPRAPTSPATPAAASTSTSTATCCSASATTSTRTPSPRRLRAARPSAPARVPRRPRAPSANTNDLRGKLLRITPSDRRRLHDPGGQPVRRPGHAARRGPRSTRWASATRSASRVDPETGWIGLADYGPDSRHRRPPTAARPASSSTT